MGVILGSNLYINFYYIISFTFGVWSLLVFGWHCVFIILTVFFRGCQGLRALTFSVALVTYYIYKVFSLSHNYFSKASEALSIFISHVDSVRGLQISTILTKYLLSILDIFS